MTEALTLNAWTFGVLVAVWFAAYMTGHALAVTWRPASHLILYSALLGLTDRFLVFALYDGELLSLGRCLIDTAILLGISLFAFRTGRARKMVSQYPWLYEPAGPFAWRRKEG